jgi:hypothetical protein
MDRSDLALYYIQCLLACVRAFMIGVAPSSVTASMCPSRSDCSHQQILCLLLLLLLLLGLSLSAFLGSRDTRFQVTVVGITNGHRVTCFVSGQHIILLSYRERTRSWSPLWWQVQAHRVLHFPVGIVDYGGPEDDHNDTHRPQHDCRVPAGARV